MSAESVERYPGKAITVLIRGERCIHSRNCVLGLPSVFVPNAEGAWVHPDNAMVEDVAALARACPSGAIAYERLDGGQAEAPPEVNTVRLRENGPIAVHADLNVGSETGSFRATLCRCGASRHKPYCDGSHHEAGFEASGEPPSKESAPLAVRNGPLNVKPLPNGPLLFEGPVEICSGTGRTITREQTTALCRCGGSANKPFCDGTHTRNGFRSEP